jgi:hypothetical protein
MQIYYTNKTSSTLPQKDPNKSLGGYISVSLVPNSIKGALFADIALTDIEKDIKKYIALMLKNTTGATRSSISIWIEVPEGSVGKYKIGLSTPNAEGQIELIDSSKSKPFYVEFNEASSEGDAIAIPNLIADAQIGIWIERSVDQEIEAIKERNNPQWLYDHRNDESPFGEEVVSLKIKYS